MLSAAAVFIVLLMRRRGGMAKHYHWVIPASPESRKQQNFLIQVRTHFVPLNKKTCSELKCKIRWNLVN
jgi:hypothetical protein